MRRESHMKRHAGFIRSCILGVTAAAALLVFSPCPRAEESGEKDLVENLDSIDEVRTFARAVHLCTIREILSEEGPFTVFAPNEEAFLNLPAESIEMLFSLDDRDALEGLLAYHVAPEVILCSGMKDASSTTALNEESLSIFPRNGTVFVQNARILRADIRCGNGVIHIIDRVILNGE